MISHRNITVCTRCKGLLQFGLLLFGVMPAVGGGPSGSSGTQTNKPHWEHIPLDEIRSIYESSELSDLEIVRALVDHLDRRISMSRSIGRMKHRPNPPSEYAMLIGFIAERVYPAKPPGRPEVIETVINSLGALENARDVQTYLYVSLGLAGGSPPESEILRVLEDPKTPEEIIAVVLDSMSRSNVPIRSLPRLLELADHPMSHIDSPGVGPPAPRRVHPIRERVHDCLDQLNIKCEKVSVKDNNVDPASKRILSTTVLKIDRDSLTTRLRDWLLDDDIEVWRAAVDIVRRVPGEDIDKMLKDLKAERALSPEKLRYLQM